MTKIHKNTEDIRLSNRQIVRHALFYGPLFGLMFIPTFWMMVMISQSPYDPYFGWVGEIIMYAVMSIIACPFAIIPAYFSGLLFIRKVKKTGYNSFTAFSAGFKVMGVTSFFLITMLSLSADPLPSLSPVVTIVKISLYFAFLGGVSGLLCFLSFDEKQSYTTRYWIKKLPFITLTLMTLIFIAYSFIAA